MSSNLNCHNTKKVLKIGKECENKIQSIYSFTNPVKDVAHTISKNILFSPKDNFRITVNLIFKRSQLLLNHC